MAAATPPHSAVLDQLQTEITRVLEQTGRVFAATGKDGRAGSIAQASRLKHILPESLNSFHDALDQLEQELRMAKLVMRRDLALCKDELGLKSPIQTDVAMAPEPDKPSELHRPVETADAEPKAEQVEPLKLEENADTAMEDAPPSEPLLQSVEKGDSDKAASQAESQPIEMTKSEENPATAEAPADTKPGDADLHVDTQNSNQQQPDEDKDIQTGTVSATNDLESLFGPTSAATDFNMETNSNGDFDFGFSTNAAAVADTETDNDNIENFLPGLQDYANSAQPSDTNNTGFDLFSNLPSGQREATDQQAEGEQGERDATFDDLFDFADLGDFPDGGGGNGSGNDNTDDLNFDFS